MGISLCLSQRPWKCVPRPFSLENNLVVDSSLNILFARKLWARPPTVWGLLLTGDGFKCWVLGVPLTHGQSQNFDFFRQIRRSFFVRRLIKTLNSFVAVKVETAPKALLIVRKWTSFLKKWFAVGRICGNFCEQKDYFFVSKLQKSATAMHHLWKLIWQMNGSRITVDRGRGSLSKHGWVNIIISDEISREWESRNVFVQTDLLTALHFWHAPPSSLFPAWYLPLTLHSFLSGNFLQSLYP